MKNEKHEAIDSDEATPLMIDELQANGANSLTLVKGRNEPALTAQVAECIFRIQNPESNDFDEFVKFVNQ